MTQNPEPTPKRARRPRERKHDHQRSHGRMEAVLSRATRERWSHEQTLEAVRREVYEQPEFKRLNAWAQGRIGGYFHGWVTALRAANLVVWTHVHPDGRRYDAYDHAERTEYFNPDGSIRNLQSKRVWAADFTREF